MAVCEKDVFPHLGERPPGVIAYTATRWGALVKPELTPAGEPTPRGSDCYRFALTHPKVDAVLIGPRDGAELDEAMAALDRGPMSDDELAWMKRVGAHIRANSAVKTGSTAITLLDRVAGFFTGSAEESHR